MSLQLQNDHSNDRKRQAGFTLVEAAVSMALLAIVLVNALTLLETTAKRDWNRQKARLMKDHG